MKFKGNTLLLLAIASVIASAVVSCGKGKLSQAEQIQLEQTPIQSISNMFAVRTVNGVVNMRIEAPKMSRFETDSTMFETFPQGISVFGYTDDGLLESLIISDDARHVTYKRGDRDELWSAFGNVVIHNVINRETMETDTIYWDRTNNQIYTDCYVKMYSPDAFMQGYGMRSDDHARNAILHNPFNSYTVSVQDTTTVMIDSVNFIGPFPVK